MAKIRQVQKLEEQLAKMEEQFRKQKEASRKNLWFPDGSEKDILELLTDYYGNAKEAAKEEKEESESKPQASLLDAEESQKPEPAKPSELSLPEPF